MYISVFRWGTRLLRNYLSNVKTKAIASDRRQKTFTMPSIAASFVAGKGSFLRHFAWFRRHKFSYLQNFDRSWSSRRCFWRWLRAVWAFSISRRGSVSCDHVNVNKPNLQNFDRLLGLPGHLQSSFLRRLHVISLLRPSRFLVLGHASLERVWLGLWMCDWVFFCFFYSIFSIAVVTVVFMLFKIIFYKGSSKCLRWPGGLVIRLFA